MSNLSCNGIGKMLLQSLYENYNSDISMNKATMAIYLNNSVGIGEHPQHLEEIDKLLDKIATTEDKLQTLKLNYGQCLK